MPDEALMCDLAHEAGLDVFNDGTQYVIHFANNMVARPLRLTLLEDVMMLIKAVLEN